jgi:hypothetical protein
MLIVSWLIFIAIAGSKCFLNFSISLSWLFIRDFSQTFVSVLANIINYILLFSPIFVYFSTNNEHSTDKFAFCSILYYISCSGRLSLMFLFILANIVCLLLCISDYFTDMRIVNGIYSIYVWFLLFISLKIIQPQCSQIIFFRWKID